MARKMSVLALLILFTLAGSAGADDVSGKIGVGLKAGLMKWYGGAYDYSNVDECFGAHIRYGLRPHWSIEGAMRYGWNRPGAEPFEDADYGFEATLPYHTVIVQPRLGLLFHMLPEHRISPWLGAGLNYTYWRIKDVTGLGDQGHWLPPDGTDLSGYDTAGNFKELTGTHVGTSITGGLEIFTGWPLAFMLGAGYHYIFDNDLDNIGLSAVYGSEHVDANKVQVEGFLGFTWYFGGGRTHDRDGDGILDEQDACPDQPEDVDNFKDTDGCPEPDNDGDGILDAQDRCPDQAEDKDGFEDSDGCPDVDNDKDGILDRNDKCPDQAEDKDGIQDEDGCPDADIPGDKDNDGISDAVDRCPDQAEDEDGFQDEDGCPDPDNDGDGVLDGLDRCPGTPAGVKVDATGCPEAKEIKAELILKGVNFASDSADLTPGSKAILDEVVQSLKAYPEVRIEIQGHTDSSGSDMHNLDLSQRRAESVRSYFVSNGIDAGRLTAVGHGEAHPITTNDTVEGRAENRRVEVHRLN